MAASLAPVVLRIDGESELAHVCAATVARSTRRWSGIANVTVTNYRLILTDSACGDLEARTTAPLDRTDEVGQEECGPDLQHENAHADAKQRDGEEDERDRCHVEKCEATSDRASDEQECARPRANPEGEAPEGEADAQCRQEAVQIRKAVTDDDETDSAECTDDTGQARRCRTPNTNTQSSSPFTARAGRRRSLPSSILTSAVIPPAVLPAVSAWRAPSPYTGATAPITPPSCNTDPVSPFGCRAVLALPLALLQSTEVRTHADSEEFHIRLRTKRGLEVTIHIAPDHECLLEHAQRVHAARRLLHHVYQFAFTKQPQLFAFFHCPVLDRALSPDVLSISCSLRAMLSRAGMLNEGSGGDGEESGMGGRGWRMTTANERYELCSTYPAAMAVPARITDEILQLAASYRSRCRLPTRTKLPCMRELLPMSCLWLGTMLTAFFPVSYVYPANGAAICRCSQPVTGISSARSEHDERLVDAIRLASSLDGNEKMAKTLHIVDARPWVNAMANTIVGKGTETESHYPNAQCSYLGIGNIHVMRTSQQALQRLCREDQSASSGEQRWMSAVEGTGWLSHIRLLLKSANRLADYMIESHSVVVHCSDGWDRTSQMTSLVMVLLDPFYRSIVGFEQLVQQEWVGAGHKFASRLGHADDRYEGPGGVSEQSPVFLQFLDCIYQLAVQFPGEFEFTEAFLLAIAYHLHSCRFGTFLFNNEKERSEADVARATPSIWDHVNFHSCFINPQYTRRGQRWQLPTPASRLRPKCSGKHVRLWARLFMPDESQREHIMTCVDPPERPPKGMCPFSVWESEAALEAAVSHILEMVQDLGG